MASLLLMDSRRLTSMDVELVVVVTVAVTGCSAYGSVSVDQSRIGRFLLGLDVMVSEMKT